MAVNEEYKNFVLDQLQEIERFTVKKQFGGFALMKEGVAFGKIKHDKLWFKVDTNNIEDFKAKKMPQ